MSTISPLNFLTPEMPAGQRGIVASVDDILNIALSPPPPPLPFRPIPLKPPSSSRASQSFSSLTRKEAPPSCKKRPFSPNPSSYSSASSSSFGALSSCPPIPSLPRSDDSSAGLPPPLKRITRLPIDPPRSNSEPIYRMVPDQAQNFLAAITDLTSQLIFRNLQPENALEQYQLNKALFYNRFKYAQLLISNEDKENVLKEAKKNINNCSGIFLKLNQLLTPLEAINLLLDTVRLELEITKVKNERRLFQINRELLSNQAAIKAINILKQLS